MSIDPRLRRALELVLRIAAFALLAWALWTALHRREHRRGEIIRVSEAASRLPVLTRDPHLVSVHAEIDSAPRATSLAWLAALRRGGVAVGWSGDVPALAASLEPVADPARGVRLAVAAPAPRVAVSDDAGVVDTLAPRGGGASIALPFVSGTVRASSGAFVATPAPADSLALRGVMIVGAAGWEGKFAAAALEERGWRVATRISVAPGAMVVQDVAPLDTSHFAAVIVLDTISPAVAADIGRFVGKGGGLVLAGAAARTPGLAAVAPGRAGDRVAARAILVADSVGPSTLGYYPIVGVKPTALPVASRGRSVAAAAMRVGAGRVVQTGIDESWRWRMEGPETGLAAHRVWWSSLVAAVAYAPPVPRAFESSVINASDSTRSPAVDALDAPRARLVDALGAPSTPPRLSASSALSPWLLAVALLLLLLEWGSRRLRGAP